MTPWRWLGAPCPFGLSLPSAQPEAHQMYAPRGVLWHGEKLLVADTGNHRVLIWNSLPEEDHGPADLVLGQPDFTSEGSQLFHLPTGLLVIDDCLLVADAWHHRVLIWDTFPTRSGQPPDRCLGQADLEGVEMNRGGSVRGDSLYWPFGLGWVNGWLWVTDTGNRRVLGWRGLPASDRPADLVLGQDSPEQGLENRGGPAAANSFRWPHAITGDGHRLWIADAGNHRLLAWEGQVETDRPAERVLGQKDFVSNAEWPYGPQNGRILRFPYSICCNGARMAVADTANNRVLLWDDPLLEEASAVIGQPDMASNGENHWKAVTAQTLCWPYGLSWSGNRLAVADSGNNRVMVWNTDG